MPGRRPKDIGTAGETAVLRALQRVYPEARRNVLHGAADIGDIGGTGQFVWEVKAGHTAWTAPQGLIEEWIGEAGREAANAGVRYGVLVVARRGFSAARADRWWTYQPLAQFSRLFGGGYLPRTVTPIRLELGELLQILGDLGHLPDPLHTDTGALTIA